MPELRLYRFPEWQETPYKFVFLKRNNTGLMPDRTEPTEHEGRLSESLSRSRRLIQEYILCNPFELFCTFTFDQSKVRNRTDYRALKSQLAKAFNNFKNRYDKNFKYLVVPELHKDGAVHFHGVITRPPDLTVPDQIPKRDIYGELRMVPNIKGYMDWPYYSSRFGYFSCSWIRDYARCAIYVTKYMTKEIADWFQRGDQIVMHSKGLQRPELIDVFYDQSIPGGVDSGRGDFDGDFCSIAMRTAMETADIYFNADDYWEHYQNEVERTAQELIVCGSDFTPVLDHLQGAWPGQRPEYPGPHDDYDPTSMYALEIAYGG